MSRFNVGDRVRVTKSNLEEFVGMTGTITAEKPFFGEAMCVKFDDDVPNSWVHTAPDGSVPWMIDWLEFE